MAEKMTVSSGNVFEDLGFAPDEAAAMLARETLLIELEKDTRISEVFNHKTQRFSVDKLVGLLHRAGKHVEIRVT